MTITYDWCKDPLYHCPQGYQDKKTWWSGHLSHKHEKHRTITVLLGDVPIIIDKVDRTFRIIYSEDGTDNGRWLFQYAADSVWCSNDGYPQVDGPATIAEDLTIVTGTVYFIDPLQNIAFWCETTCTCTIGQTASKWAAFHGAYGTFYSHWFDFMPERTTVERYYLCIDGKKELIETYTVTMGVQEHYNVLFPLPPSNVGEPQDVFGYGIPDPFYDYFGEPDRIERDGGPDWYFPDWWRGTAGDHTEDSNDASDRYAADYCSHGDISAATYTIKIPTILPESNPKGNACTNSDGNVLLSFTAHSKTINRLYIKGTPGFIDIDNDIMDGSNLKIFPVGIV